MIRSYPSSHASWSGWTMASPQKGLAWQFGPQPTPYSPRLPTPFVARLAAVLLHDRVAAVRTDAAIGRALVVAAEIARSVVALFAGADLAVAAVRAAVARHQVEARERELERRAVLLRARRGTPR